jgi:pyrroloquinoline quinone (PQQ) biosynthesis protein C
VGHYHTTRATCIFMRYLAGRFEAMARPDLAAFALSTIQGESGHDRLALRDLRALGFPAEEVVAALKPPRSAALLKLFHEYTYGEDPVAAFGYGYALERSCIAITPEYVASIERLIPAGLRATRCLRVHSSIGAEVAHVEDSVRAIAALPAADRSRIARAVAETARIMFAPLGPGELAGEPLAAFLRGHAPNFESMGLSKSALAGAGAVS